MVGAILARSLERHGECQFCRTHNSDSGLSRRRFFFIPVVLIDSCEKRFGVVK